MSGTEFFAWTFILALLAGFIGYSVFSEECPPVQVQGGCY